MDLNEVPNDHMVIQVEMEEKKGANFDDIVSRDLEDSRVKSSEVEQRCREVEEKRLALELEIRRKHIDLGAIKVKIRDLEGEKVEIEEQIKVLKMKKAALEGAEVNDTVGGSLNERKRESDEVSKVDQLMIENEVLECEKSSALREVEVWKQSCKELELRVLELEGKLRCQAKDGISIGLSISTIDSNGGGASTDFRSPSRFPGARDGKVQPEAYMSETPCVGTPEKRYVRRRLALRNERSCEVKIDPPTPAGARPSSVAVVDIIDSDNEYDVPAKHGPTSQGTGAPCVTPGVGVDEPEGIMVWEEKSGGIENSPSIATPKRKRDPKVITSDDDDEDNDDVDVNADVAKRRACRIENSDNEGEEDDDDIIPIKRVFNRVNTKSESDDDDDHIPISQLKMNHTRRSRRLIKYGQGNQKDRAHKEMGVSSDTRAPDNVLEDELEDLEGESASDAGSLSSFIVDDSDVEYVEDEVSEEDDICDSYKPEEEESDSNVDFDEIISRLQSRRDRNSKWVSEGDMLSDFGKDNELCMRAVCALYRQQTTTEKECKASIILNRRGFSKLDASRGTNLGQFLTDGDQNGDLVKSVEELRKHDPDGVELCCTLAKHYSKQLFEIYMNKEDPFFLPSTPSP